MMGTERKVIRVREVMKSNFDIIDGRVTVMEALRTMKHVETKALVVDKRNENDEYGMVLISDIAKLVLAKDRSPDRVNVYEIMAKPLLPVDPDMDIRYCARYFENFSLSRAPVIENKKVIGIISFTDMVLKGLVNF
jgi:predicted transcriptional regulator